MIKGIITKGIGGFYYVEDDDRKVYECRARGRFRKDKITPLVGDRVKIRISHDDKGYIEEILDRDTKLIRPPVANVDQAVIVFAVKKPNPNIVLLDRFLVMAEKENLDIVICFNKIDLSMEELNKLRQIYENTGYKVLSTSTKTETGVEEFKEILKNKITVFAGPSGVGKSSLLNTTQPNLKLKTGDVSLKSQRGKHTTRHVELLKLDFGGWVLDTPGFSSLNLDSIEENELQFYFREFEDYRHDCKYRGCMHVNEPQCVVKEKVKEGIIDSSRYANYLHLLKEIQENRRY